MGGPVQPGVGSNQVYAAGLLAVEVGFDPIDRARRLRHRGLLMKPLPLACLALSALLVIGCNKEKAAIDANNETTQTTLDQQKANVDAAAKEARAQTDVDAKIDKAVINANQTIDQAQLDAEKKKADAEAEAAKAKVEAEKK